MKAERFVDGLRAVTRFLDEAGSALESSKFRYAREFLASRRFSPICRPSTEQLPTLWQHIRGLIKL